ncbi:hypothetical protein V7S43_014929 [Phytophthora oleae]|uniref:B box-type domain-containing protein n=1 Tax=Phytophthora oleae TaxID=2107226 RepID=A0ABD3F4I5_9STRA
MLFTATAQTSQAQSTANTTPNGSPATLPAPNNHHQENSSSGLLRTPETASSDKSENDAEPNTSESGKGAKQDNGDQNGPVAAENTTHSGNSETIQQQEEQATSAAQASVEKQNEKAKMWFEVLPVVLENFKAQNREQIKQLMLPRCELCERGKVTKKAQVKCNQGGCILKERPLCDACWKSTHSSDGAQRHRRLSASICRQCQQKPIVYWCADCDLKFCSECFEQIHSVPRTRDHRKLATEDAPGTCLVKSHWPGSMEKAISQIIKARKNPHPVASSANNVGEKRKRDVEVIVIDDEESDNEEANDAQVNLTSASGTSQQPGYDESAMNQAAGIESRNTPPGVLLSELTQPTVATAVNPSAQHSMLEPIAFPPDLQQATSIPLASSAQLEAVQSSSSYGTTPLSSGMNSVNVASRLESLPWNQFGATSPMGNGSTTDAFATSVMSNGMMQTSMPTAMSTTGGMWSTTSAISTDLASISNTGNLLPLGGAVFAENALVDSLVDRYHEVNHNVLNLEMQSEQLTRQIAVATCQGPYAAAPIMGMLSKVQAVLEEARRRRDKMLIAMIIQSNDIMAAVRLLRMTELGDVPQVPIISHRKCLQISNEINQHKKELIELNQQLSMTLSQSRAVDSSWENELIRTTSANIQMHEESIKKLKKEREVEFVRIVQFSYYIRQLLKQTFQRSVELQQQRQQFQQH